MVYEDMNKRVNSKKAPLYPQNGKKMELQGKKSETAEKTIANRRERKLALLQDVDNLKKKLRHEENIHRALERAMNRPLRALPRLPPYLPQHTLELLAEVAVLEEEVFRLEEQIVKFRQGLYQEAVSISSRKSPEDLNKILIRNSKQNHSRSSSCSDVNLGQFGTPSSSIASTNKFLSEKKQPQNGHSLILEDENLKDRSCQEKKTSAAISRRLWNAEQPLIKKANSPKMQCRIVEQAQESSSDDRVVEIESEANKMSEDILKCLISTFVRLSSSKGKTVDFESFSSLSAKTFSEESNTRDPYCNLSEFKTRDIGAYKDLYVIEPRSIDLSRKTHASFLIRRLKLLLDKLASSVKLDGLNHQQKLAFWINIYNSCIMNAFLEQGIPDSPDMIVIQMQKATIKVGGHVLNALMIEHLILRLPYHLKYTCSKSEKNDEKKIRRTLGLEWSEPLVTFALSCGSWSSPAVRVYTASKIENELETAKREYLQAAIAISVTNKLVIPKLLDWYLLDFAKDLDGLLDWICLQLPDELRSEANECLERRGKEPLSKLIQVMPYNFSFRYIVCL